MSKHTVSPHLATVAAIVAARATDPRSFVVDVDPAKGIAGALVLVKAPSAKHTPSALRDAFAAAIDRAPDGVIVDSAGTPRPVPASALPLTSAFLDSLPEVISPVAALGLAVRAAVEPDGSTKWVHNRQKDNTSRWTYCAARVTADSVSIRGDATCAEASADGRLTIDADVPAHIATALRNAYDQARAVVEPSRVLTMVVAHLRAVGGRQITADVYLLPETDPTTCGVLAGLVDLGGWADSVAVADPAKIARLTSPVTKSIEEQIDDVIKAAQDFITKAADVVKPGSTTTIRKGTGDTARARLSEARAAAALWRDRLGLASLDVDAKLSELDAAAKAADDAAIAHLDAQRKARVEAKKADAELRAHLAAVDDEQAAEERREAHTSPATH